MNTKIILFLSILLFRIYWPIKFFNNHLQFFLGKTLINIGIFLTYCLIGSFLSIIKFYLNYKKFTLEERN